MAEQDFKFDDALLMKTACEMFAKYAYGNVPEWFASAVSATSYVLSVDKGNGIECISALHTAAERAPAEIRMTAQTKLLMVCQETGMIGGIGPNLSTAVLCAERENMEPVQPEPAI